MIVFGLDPGTEQSAFVLYTDSVVLRHETVPNGVLLGIMSEWPDYEPVLVIEKIESFGMAVGAETFATVFWSGRFAQEWHSRGRRFEQMGRRIVKTHLCHSSRATDANIRQALIDRFGPGKDKAIGTKKAQGPLYGVKGHEYAALAVAVTFWDQNQNAVRPGVAADF